MISPYEKVQLVQEQCKSLTWSLADLRGLVYGVENQLRGRIPRYFQSIYAGRWIDRNIGQKKNFKKINCWIDNKRI